MFHKKQVLWNLIYSEFDLKNLTYVNPLRKVRNLIWNLIYKLIFFSDNEKNENFQFRLIPNPRDIKEILLKKHKGIESLPQTQIF